MILDAGKLDRALQLITRTTIRDAVGQPTDTWSVAASTFAQRMMLREADLRSGAGIETVPMAKYLIRWRSNVTNDMRVRIDGADYSITAIDEPDRRRTLVLTLQYAAPAPAVVVTPPVVAVSAISPLMLALGLPVGVPVSVVTPPVLASTISPLMLAAGLPLPSPVAVTTPGAPAPTLTTLDVAVGRL